jgi:hypothetical protein
VLGRLPEDGGPKFRDERKLFGQGHPLSVVPTEDETVGNADGNEVEPNNPGTPLPHGLDVSPGIGDEMVAPYVEQTLFASHYSEATLAQGRAEIIDPGHAQDESDCGFGYELAAVGAVAKGR